MKQSIDFIEEQLTEKEIKEKNAASNDEEGTCRSMSSLVLTEEDIEVFLDNEMAADKQGTPSEIDSKYVPEVGMQFSRCKEAQSVIVKENNGAWVISYVYLECNHVL